MEDVYKNALNELRKNKYKANQSDDNMAIYGIEWFYGQPKVQVKQPETISEKSLILDSFSQKVKEEMATSNSSKIVKNGAVIELKEVKGSNAQHVCDVLSLDQIKQQASHLISSDSASIRYLDKSNIKVMFVSDFLHIKDNYEQNEFNCLFEGDISNLFSNMVKAMRLEKSEFLLSAMKVKGELEDVSYQSTLLSEISHFKPQLIITLGVSATHGLLDIKDRIKDIHGQFYSLSVNGNEFDLLPLFSPHLLGSAPNMKKIAWADMQKAMEKLSL